MKIKARSYSINLSPKEMMDLLHTLMRGLESTLMLLYNKDNLDWKVIEFKTLNTIKDILTAQGRDEHIPNYIEKCDNMVKIAKQYKEGEDRASEIGKQDEK